MSCAARCVPQLFSHCSKLTAITKWRSDFCKVFWDFLKICREFDEWEARVAETMVPTKEFYLKISDSPCRSLSLTS